MENSFQEQQKIANSSIQQIVGSVQERNVKQRALTIDSYMSKESSDQKNQQFFTPIMSLLNIGRYKRKDAKNMSYFSQSHQHSKVNVQKTQKVVSFVEPENIIKTIFEQHTVTLNINQVKSYSSTKKGLRNFEKLQNQDVIMIQRIANEFKFFAIFDGHGEYGKLIAETCARYLKKVLKSYEQEFKRDITNKQIIQIIKNCIIKIQAFLHNSKFNEVQYSGATCLIVLVTPRSIFSFNIGNSRLLIGMKEQNSQKIYDFQVTHDHDLNRLDERLRVLKHETIISPLKDQLGQSLGPDRLWLKNQKRPGTFITRTLGLTCGLKAGIISDPQVSVLQYNKRMKFLVLASDGLWGVQENDEVISYLQRYYRQGQLGMGVQSLIEEATNRWKARKQLMDDISIIGVSLSYQI